MPPALPIELMTARPGFAVDGEARLSLTDGLIELTIREDSSGLYRCEAAFGNWGDKDGDIGYLYFDREMLDFGKDFAVTLGEDTIFAGRITGIEAQFPEQSQPRLVVLAEDRLQDLRMTRRTRTFADSSDADAIDQIASDHGLTADIDLPGSTHAVLAQVNQSDLAFVRDRLRVAGGELWVDGTTLTVRRRGARVGATVQLAYGARLREFSAVADLAHQRTAVLVNGWDVAGKQAISHEATDAVVSGELAGGDSGAAVLSAAFGERKDALAHTVPVTTAQAEAEAEAHFRLIARRFLVGRGVTDVDAALRVGASVDLDGLGPLFSGTWQVTETVVSFDGLRGLRCEFACERAGLGKAP